MRQRLKDFICGNAVMSFLVMGNQCFLEKHYDHIVLFLLTIIFITAFNFWEKE